MRVSGRFAGFGMVGGKVLVSVDIAKVCSVHLPGVFLREVVCVDFGP